MLTVAAIADQVSRAVHAQAKAEPKGSRSGGVPVRDRKQQAAAAPRAARDRLERATWMALIIRAGPCAGLGGPVRREEGKVGVRPAIGDLPLLRQRHEEAPLRALVAIYSDHERMETEYQSPQWLDNDTPSEGAWIAPSLMGS